MASRKESDQQSIHHDALADDYFFQLAVEWVDRAAQILNALIDLLNIHGHDNKIPARSASKGAPCWRCGLAYAGSYPGFIIRDFAFVDNLPANCQHGGMHRLSLRRFGQIVAEVMKTLPGELQQYLDNVVVDVQEEPDVETLRQQGFSDAEIAEGESLYGLFAPIDLPTAWGGDVIDVRDLPHRIIIYKRPLEEDFPRRRQLMIEIRKTVVHELAHHFGYSDRDLEKFDDNPNPFPDIPENQEPTGKERI
jgi:predicted Zn-dependent protease with MMP-like domain